MQIMHTSQISNAFIELEQMYAENSDLSGEKFEKKTEHEKHKNID